VRLSENASSFLQTQYMLDQLSDLQGKEHILLDANRALSMKVYDDVSLSLLQFLFIDGNFK